MARKKQVIRDFYRPREFAERTGMHINTVYRLIARNEIPAMTLPGHPMLLIPAAFIEQVTAALYADWEASSAGAGPDAASAPDASVPAANPAGRPAGDDRGPELGPGVDGD